MADKTLSSQTVTSLAGKLDEFAEVLTSEEHAVLLGLLGMASATIEQAHSGVDTEDFAASKSVLTLPSAQRLPSLSTGLKDAFRALPGFDPIGPVSDSIGVGVACVSWSKDYNKGIPNLGEQMRIRGLRQTR